MNTTLGTWARTYAKKANTFADLRKQVCDTPSRIISVEEEAQLFKEYLLPSSSGGQKLVCITSIKFHEICREINNINPRILLNVSRLLLDFPDEEVGTYHSYSETKRYGIGHVIQTNKSVANFTI